MSEFHGTKAVQRLVVNVTTIGDNSLVAAPASPREGVKYRVVGAALSASGGANNVKFRSATTDVTGVFALAANGLLMLPTSETGWCETAPGQALQLNLSAATAVTGVVLYVEV